MLLMFKKKKDKDLDTPADLRLKELYVLLSVLEDEFSSIIKKIIRKKEIIAFYPNGVDKDKAIKAYHFAQQYLLILVRKYDYLKDEINNFLDNNKEVRRTTAGYGRITQSSHDKIEIIYDMIKRSTNK